MNIYYVANVAMPTGKAHGIHVAKTAEALIEAGNSVTLVIPSRRKSAETIQSFYGLRVSVPTMELGSFYFKNPAPIRYRLNALIFAVSYTRFFRRRTKDTDAVIYTVDIDKWSSIGLPFTNLPYFSEIHGAEKKSFIQHAVFKRIRGIIATTGITANELIQTFALDTSKVCVEPNGTDTYEGGAVTKQEARKRLGLKADRPLVLYVGRVIGWKGIDILPTVAEILPDATIGFLGATKEEYEGLLGISGGKMTFHGSVPHTEVPLWIQASDACLVMGTFKNRYSSYYSSPMKVFEYMQMERPVIASKTPVFEDLFSEDTVTFFEPDNAESLAHTISSLLADKKRQEEISFKGKEYAREHSWRKRGERISHFMRECLS